MQHALEIAEERAHHRPHHQEEGDDAYVLPHLTFEVIMPKANPADPEEPLDAEVFHVTQVLPTP